MTPLPATALRREDSLLYRVAEQAKALEPARRAAPPPADASPDPRPLLPRIHRDLKRGPWLQLLQPHAYEWNRIELPVPGLPARLDGLRILHLTDFHLRRRWYAACDKLQDDIRRTRPDLILFTGDFVDNRYDCHPAAPNVVRLFEQFHAPLGCFAIFGNHDQSRRTPESGLAPYLEKTPVRLIDGGRHVIDHAEAGIELIGLPGLHRDELKQSFLDGLPPRPRDAVRMVLGHYPDQIRKAELLRPDLYLTGHTHGGQCCLPNGFPLITHDRLPRRYAKGLHRWNDQTWMVVNRGIGFSGPAIRTFCPAEVIELTLWRA